VGELSENPSQDIRENIESVRAMVLNIFKSFEYGS
jgi:hypothetical protein